MTNKITLITPPDIYENGNLSLLFMHINDQDQEMVSRWLAERELSSNINFYIYNGEIDIPWLLWAVNLCQYKYIDLDLTNELSKLISSYILSKNNFYYKTADENLAALYSHINNNRVVKIESFLERALSEQNK
jgi:hypothetical protein